MRNHSRPGSRALALLVVGVLAAGAMALIAPAAGAATTTLANLKVTADNVPIKAEGQVELRRREEREGAQAG